MKRINNCYDGNGNRIHDAWTYDNDFLDSNDKNIKPSYDMPVWLAEIITICGIALSVIILL